MGVIIQIPTEKKRVRRRKCGMVNAPEIIPKKRVWKMMVNAPEIILKKRGPGSRMIYLSPLCSVTSLMVMC